MSALPTPHRCRDCPHGCCGDSACPLYCWWDCGCPDYPLPEQDLDGSFYAALRAARKAVDRG